MNSANEPEKLMTILWYQKRTLSATFIKHHDSQLPQFSKPRRGDEEFSNQRRGCALGSISVLFPTAPSVINGVLFSSSSVWDFPR